MKAHTHEFPVVKMSKVLGVSRSGYYLWLQQGASTDPVVDELDKEIKDIFNDSRQTYGSPRVTIKLNEEQNKASESNVARRMKKLGLQAIKPKRFVVTTQSDDDNPVAKNLLDREFEADRPAEKWVSDITYLEIDRQWFYLTVVVDLADRSVVGWTLSNNMTVEDTTLAALAKAILNRKPEDKLLFHSDRGAQYSCGAFSDQLESIGAIQSMSRKGNCWDNAVAESFFKTLKTECVNRHDFHSYQQAWSVIFDYIDGWYNTCRIHTSLGGITPKQAYEVKTKMNQAA
tara:strand:+ start:520 stop:1380 length:861 start_codon:yes stop_codon:yes gene_type:complete